MGRYLFIESNDPFERNDVERFYDLAASLARAHNEVTLFLVQNGVLPARRSDKSPLLEALREAGVQVLADDFSLRERGIPEARLSPAVRAAPIDAVVQQLTAGAKALWH